MCVTGCRWGSSQNRKSTRFPNPLCPRLHAAMSPPFADQPAALPRAPSALPMAAPFGDPALTLTLLYSSTCTGTARGDRAATRVRKGIAFIAVVLTLVCSSQSVGFALPPAPEPIEINQARSKPGGFLRGPFQVFWNLTVARRTCVLLALWVLLPRGRTEASMR